MTYSPLWRKALALMPLLAAGCHEAPRVLVAQEYIGQRVIRYTLVPSSQTSEEVGPLFDLKMVVCDHGENGVETRCTESIVLQNVTTAME